MRPQTISQTGVGTSTEAVVDYRQSNFKVGVACVVSGTATYTLQHSYDGTTWFDNSDAALVAATTNQDTGYTTPILSSRINLTTGTGTVTATYLQGN